MYVVNINEVPEIKTFKCGKSLSDWLIKEKNFSLLSVDDNGKFCFADNELLREVLENKPFIFDVLEIFQ